MDPVPHFSASFSRLLPLLLAHFPQTSVSPATSTHVGSRSQLCFGGRTRLRSPAIHRRFCTSSGHRRQRLIRNHSYSIAIPEEERKENRRFDRVDNYDCELPEEFEMKMAGKTMKRRREMLLKSMRGCFNRSLDYQLKPSKANPIVAPISTPVVPIICQQVSANPVNSAWIRSQSPKAKVVLLEPQEEMMRGKPGYEHLNEPLHIIVEAELPMEIIDSRLIQARDILEELLKPMDESLDMIKKQQLRELAMLNGTLRDDSSQISGSVSPFHNSLGMKRAKTRG